MLNPDSTFYHISRTIWTITKIVWLGKLSLWNFHKEIEFREEKLEILNFKKDSLFFCLNYFNFKRFTIMNNNNCIWIGYGPISFYVT